MALVRRQQVGREGADDVPVPCPYGAQKIAAGPIRDLIELAPEHGDTGLRVLVMLASRAISRTI